LQRFDLIVGNPPYIRYQFFDRKQQVEAGDIFIKAGLTYSKLTNASFVFKLEDGSFTEPISTESVKKTGKKDIARKSLRKKYKIKERHLRS
jgi:methylase of polypeptide subunit release factors